MEAKCAFSHLVAMDVFSIYGQDFTYETHVVIIIHTIV